MKVFLSMLLGVVFLISCGDEQPDYCQPECSEGYSCLNGLCLEDQIKVDAKVDADIECVDDEGCDDENECSIDQCIDNHCQHNNKDNGSVCSGENHACFDGQCFQIPTCDDDIKNQDEIGVDCGGKCGDCTFCNTQTQIPVSECKALEIIYQTMDGPNWKDHTNWLENEEPCSWFGITCFSGHVSRLSFYRNNLKGTIPPQLTQLKELKDLGFAWNFINGSIPPELGQMVNLTSLGLGGNQLTGSIPKELGSLHLLTHIWLNDNQLVGSIPSEIKELKKLIYFQLQRNQLSGELPGSLMQLSELKGIGLFGNQCLIANDAVTPGFSAWLSNLDPKWNDGCH